MKISNWLRSTGTGLLSGFRRFPAAPVLAMAVTVLLMCIIHLDGQADAATENLVRAVFGCVMAFPAALIQHLLLERLQRPPAYKPVGILPEAGAFAVLAAAVTTYIWFMMPKPDDIPIIRTLLLIGALVVLLVVTPYWWRRGGLALHATRLLTRLLVTMAYSGILMLALFAILFTLDRLLSVQVQSEHYADAAVLVWALFAPLHLAAGMPGVREVPGPADAPKTLRFLLQRILMPLLWIYAGILYAYSARILIEREWPHGIVSSLILAWLCIGLLVWFLSSPAKADNRMAAIYHTAFPWAALPLFVILFLAIGMRVSEYGITEERWFVLALAVWCCAAAAFLAIRSLIRSRDPEAAGFRVIWLPVSLAAIMTATVIGPFNAFDVSIRSQNRQLEALLIRHDMLVSERMRAPAGDIPTEDRQRIADILMWFDANHELTDVDSLPDGMTLANARDTLGFDVDGVSSPAGDRYVRFETADRYELVDIDGFDRMIPLPYGDMTQKDSGTGITLHYDGDRVLTLEREGGVLYRQDFDDLLKKLMERSGATAGGSSRHVLAREEMTFDAGTDDLRVRIVLQGLGGMAGEDGATFKAEDADGWLLIDLP